MASKKTQAQKNQAATANARAQALAQEQLARQRAGQHTTIGTYTSPSVKGQGAPQPAVLPPGMVAVQPEPFDPYLENQRITAIRNIGLGDAEAGWQQGQLQRNSGFDANGNLVTAGADFNPFSQAMLLQDEYKRGQTGTLNSYAAMGQYNSGAYGRAQGRQDRLYAQGYDALRTGTQAAYHGIQAGRLQNYASNSLGVSDADFAALRRNFYGGS
jgi:hypothetical protein